MAGLKVVALVSGGKDSFFSILHCHANGHKVVALANLHPATQDIADMDSYMYQTIGHSIIPLYAQALDLPLYRQNIHGSAVDQSKSYNPKVSSHDTHGRTDEAESMLAVLREAKDAQPEINAVCSGAILSHYQRTRVESVALRLGLIPLSYLWQFPYLPPHLETSLLDDMATVGQDSRIIKTASGGLDEKSLWLNVADPGTPLKIGRAMRRFGDVNIGALLGEGGEFETLAIDGPLPLWKHRILVEEKDRAITAGDAGSVALAIHSASLVMKEPNDSPSESPLLRKPPVFDDLFEDYRQSLKDYLLGTSPITSANSQVHSSDASLPTACTHESGRQQSMNNLTGNGENAAEQMSDIMKHKVCGSFGFNSETIIASVILLSSMSDFAAVNAVYGSFFDMPNPPARITISCGNLIPDEKAVMVSVTTMSVESLHRKRGLHVQSQSYWAPANIGPYSQAIGIPLDLFGADEDTGASTVYIAGQIPLEPANMRLYCADSDASADETIASQTILSLQHLWRIGQVMDVNLWLGAVAFVSSESMSTSTKWVSAAIKAWDLAHNPPAVNEANEQEEDDDEVDVWDLTHGRHSLHSNIDQAPESTYRECIQKQITPPCIVAEVYSLPRNAPIEFTSKGLTFGSDSATYTNKSLHNLPLVAPGRYHDIAIHVREAKASSCALAWGWVSFSSIHALADAYNGDGSFLEGQATKTIHVAGKGIPPNVAGKVTAQVVPCRRLWDWEGREVAAVVAYQRSVPDDE